MYHVVSSKINNIEDKSKANIRSAVVGVLLRFLHINL